jgi:hypothetical protein
VFEPERLWPVFFFFRPLQRFNGSTVHVTEG